MAVKSELDASSKRQTGLTSSVDPRTASATTIDAFRQEEALARPVSPALPCTPRKAGRSAGCADVADAVSGRRPPPNVCVPRRRHFVKPPSALGSTAELLASQKPRSLKAAPPSPDVHPPLDPTRLPLSCSTRIQDTSGSASSNISEIWTLRTRVRRRPWMRGRQATTGLALDGVTRRTEGKGYLEDGRNGLAMCGTSPMAAPTRTRRWTTMPTRV